MPYFIFDEFMAGVNFVPTQCRSILMKCSEEYMLIRYDTSLFSKLKLESLNKSHHNPAN